MNKMLRVSTSNYQKIWYPALAANERIDKLEKVLMAARQFVFEIETIKPNCSKSVCPDLVEALREVEE
jgi:hypothetical protein